MKDRRFKSGSERIFSFFRVPKRLFEDEKYADISAMSKLLYGMLIDRMDLSQKNGWIDEEGYVYIYYTVAEVMKQIGCSDRTVTKLFQELERVELIERVKVGVGNPDRIYVCSFIELQNIENPEMNTEKFTTHTRKIYDPYPKNLRPNHTEYNHTDINHTDIYNNIYNNIHRNTPPIIPPHGGNEDVPEMEIDKYDAMIPDDIQGCVRRELRDWLEYKHEKKQDYTEMGLKKLFTQVRNSVQSNGEQSTADSISSSMSSNYMGIVFDRKSGNRGQAPKKTGNPFLELAKRLEQEGL